VLEQKKKPFQAHFDVNGRVVATMAKYICLKHPKNYSENSHHIFVITSHCTLRDIY